MPAYTGHDFPEHTADLACEIRAPTLEALLAEAGRAFTDAITPVDGVRSREERVLGVSAPSPPELLVAWLEELLYLFETTDLLASRTEVHVEGGSGGLRLEATVGGEAFDAVRHPLRTLIKGITYHELLVEEGPDGWRARVIFDV